MVKLFKIQGDSLYPLVKEGQRVLCIKAFRFIELNIGDIVVFEKQGYGMMIKQIITIDKSGYFVKGTDPSSVDSRDFGTLDHKEIKYKVVLLLH